MILGISTLAIALLISAVSAYYSISGLVAIFPAAVIPIIIMGAALETGKVITAVWLHVNWYRCDWKFRVYLLPALISLMLLNSMGTFGFLSRAHLAQAAQTGDVQAQIDLIDAQIKTQQDNIGAARSSLQQLDAAVDQTLGRSTTEAGARHASQLRRSQLQERNQLQKEITEFQTSVLKLQQQRAPLGDRARQAAAEVGPIKYVAALIYGDNPNGDLLERAVRWVIVLIVVVFDPLAVVLVLAGAKQLEWERKTTRDTILEKTPEHDICPEEPKPETVVEVNDPPPEPETHTDLFDSMSERSQQDANDVDIDPMGLIDTVQDHEIYEDPVPTLLAQIEELETRLKASSENNRVLSSEIERLVRESKDLINSHQAESSRLEQELLESRIRMLVPDQSASTRVEQELLEARSELERISAEKDQLMIAVQTLESQLRQPQINDIQQDALIPLPQEIPGAAPVISWGRVFPVDPHRGDLYLRLDFKPWKLFKWNDTGWIEVRRDSTDSLAYDERYVEFLADCLASGDCHLDDLTDLEHQQLAAYLAGHP